MFLEQCCVKDIFPFQTEELEMLGMLQVPFINLQHAFLFLCLSLVTSCLLRLDYLQNLTALRWLSLSQ